MARTLPILRLTRLLFQACTFNLLAAMFISLDKNGGVSCDLSYGSEENEFILAIMMTKTNETFTGFVSNYRDENCKFALGKIGSLTGTLVRVTGPDGVTNDACEPIDPSQWPNETWILLAKYGTCKDDVKMKNIAKTNASAAIIYDFKTSPRYVRLHNKSKYYLIDILLLLLLIHFIS